MERRSRTPAFSAAVACGRTGAGATCLSFLMLLAVALTAGCDKGTAVRTDGHAEATEALPTAIWEDLAGRRVLFGHQSVGSNILRGIEEIRPTSQAPPALIGLEPSAPSAAAGVYHFTVGRNGDPAGKMADFAHRLDAGRASAFELAGLKLCYADFRPDTDVEALFRRYREMASDLRSRYPNLRLFHVTVPLESREPWWRTAAKRALGRPTTQDFNVQREAYNDLLRREYDGREPLFDLAKIEATGPDGVLESTSAKGRTVIALSPAYTGDGAHLDERGRRIIAPQFVRFLAATLRAGSPGPQS